MGSPFFSLGEKKVRPGVYKRYVNAGPAETPQAVYGVVAIPIQTDSGPLSKVNTYTADQLQDFLNLYGSGGTANAVTALFEGGAKQVYVYRLGSGGTAPAVTLSEVLTLTSKYVTTQSLNVTIKAVLGSETQKQLLVYNGTTLLETINYTTGTTDSAAIAAAVNAQSEYLTATSSSDALVANVTNTPLTGGTAPTVNTESYSDALTAFEPYTWNILVLDTVNADAQALVQPYINRIFQNGALGVAVLGAPTSTAIATRISNATAYNDEKIIYLGSGFQTADGTQVDGYLAIAKQAGVLASLTSADSPTHTVIPGAVATLEDLTNTQYTNAILGGLLMLSPNNSGQVWFDAGINTLVNPAENQDEGWKKIRRTNTRFEVFDRIDRAVAPLIGKVNCDDIGVGDVILAGQAVLDAMFNEGKILAGAVFGEDLSQNRGPDYAYFTIALDDIDTLEKIYLTYQFRFTAE